MVDPGTSAAAGKYARSKDLLPNSSVRAAWVLFLIVGLPLALMMVLTVIADAGVYVDPFRPFWVPWPPDLYKPFVGLAGFVATLGYLVYVVGHRKGYHSGNLAGIASARNWAEGRYKEAEAAAAAVETPPPPPPPVEAVVNPEAPTAPRTEPSSAEEPVAPSAEPPL